MPLQTQDCGCALRKKMGQPASADLLCFCRKCMGIEPARAGIRTKLDEGFYITSDLRLPPVQDVLRVMPLLDPGKALTDSPGMLREFIIIPGERKPCIDQNAIVSMPKSIPIPPILQVLAVFFNLGGSNERNKKALSQ